jgi:hypothetical protein
MMFRPAPEIIGHEAVHMAVAELVGLEVQPAQFDVMNWDGWQGRVMLTEAERDRLTGTFDERFKIATVAMAPSLVMFNDNSSGDAALVDSMCPSDYTLRLWRFVVENHARKQISSDVFGDAFGRAEATIEEQLALEGDLIG